VDLTRLGGLIDDLRQAGQQAYSDFEHIQRGYDPEYVDVAYSVEIAFLKLLVACEALGLDSLKNLVLRDIEEAKASKGGFGKTSRGPEEPYLQWMGRFSQFTRAIETLGGPEQGRSVTKDLTEILRASIYSITDLRVFGKVPTSEDEVHRRIEGVLKCIFPDLKHKPTLSKQIKNFEPDTGLPSLRTLIEYKFISRPDQVAQIAEQILADTRGYDSKDWSSFVYVIYEARRLRPEPEWIQLLRECGVPKTTTVIVLTGEPLVAEGDSDRT
jgi:hypothetical protein